jgi:hypothetical protein
MYLVEEKPNNMTCISYLTNPIATILDTSPNNHYKKNMVFFIGESNEKEPHLDRHKKNHLVISDNLI